MLSTRAIQDQLVPLRDFLTRRRLGKLAAEKKNRRFDLRTRCVGNSNTPRHCMGLESLAYNGDSFNWCQGSRYVQIGKYTWSLSDLYFGG